ncbi:helix-turn-helix domain-containing protein [Burkholderia cenocepacia]|uniref:helix-turn-helix domain-containing protein n=1 Tax=Burkholderia cenocepacia TaxID=95486 RepID=UPI002864D978|nr:helix-turn-helix domain-containing protein [Burkholderia cenocepacia]MDR5646946.1 Fis family transcriptional regulator [Burkholderia cenocepacia]
MVDKGSPQALQQLLNTARAQFVAGDRLPTALLPASVARSWERSRAAGVLPWQKPQYELLDTGRRSLRESRDDQRLYSCVVDEIESLWAAFGSANWVIFCANPQGTVIHARRSPSCDDSALLPIEPGRQIVEDFIGTTAPSCVLHEGAEGVVAGCQHYLKAFDRLFCVAVPLFGLQGNVIGALDITGVGQRNVAEVQEQFRLAALAAEQRLFATLRGCHLLRVQHDPRWLDTALAGVLAVEEDGHVRAASRIARRMLGLPQREPLASLRLRDLFPATPAAQLDRLFLQARGVQRLLCTDGSHLWAQHARAPLNRSTARRPYRAGKMRTDNAVEIDRKSSSNTALALSDATLQEHALEAIRRAFDLHKGNVAAAARQLGISRTTFYAKLRQAQQAGMSCCDPGQAPAND